LQARQSALPHYRRVLAIRAFIKQEIKDDPKPYGAKTRAFNAAMDRYQVSDRRNLQRLIKPNPAFEDAMRNSLEKFGRKNAADMALMRRLAKYYGVQDAVTLVYSTRIDLPYFLPNLADTHEELERLRAIQGGPRPK